jgi:hypothetical protein
MTLVVLLAKICCGPAAAEFVLHVLPNFEQTALYVDEIMANPLSDSKLLSPGP